METVGIIGFFALAVGIIMLIVNAFRKRRLRTWGIVAGVGLVFFIIGVSLSGPAAPSPQPTQTPSQLITEDASEMVLTITDFEPGWVQHGAQSTTKEGAQSAYHVYFYEGKSLYPSVVQNTTAVYPSIEFAQQVYFNAIPNNVSVENPKIGDESFLDISVPMQKLLVFRKSNVVVWLWLQQDVFGDVKPYARIIEKRISTLP